MDGVGRHQTTEGEKHVALFWCRLHQIVHTLLAKSNAALRTHHSFDKIFIGSMPRILEQRNCAHEDLSVETHRVMVLSLSFIF